MTAIPRPADDAQKPPDRELDDLITSHLDGGLDAAGQRRLAALLAAGPQARATLARYLRLEAALVRLASAGLVNAGPDSVGRGDIGRGDIGRGDIERGSADPGALGRAADPPVTIAAVPGRSWLRPGPLALAGATLAATIAAVLVVGRPEPGAARAADMAIVADSWIALRSAEAAPPLDAGPDVAILSDADAGRDAEAPEPDDGPDDDGPYDGGSDNGGSDDDQEAVPGSPPSWLVAAIADERPA